MRMRLTCSSQKVTHLLSAGMRCDRGTRAASSMSPSFVLSPFHPKRHKRSFGSSLINKGSPLPLYKLRSKRVSNVITTLSTASNGIGTGAALLNDKDAVQPTIKDSSYLGRRHWSPIMRFLYLAWRQWRLLIPAILAALIASCCSIVQPILFGGIVGVISRTEGLPYSVTSRRLMERMVRLIVVYCFEVLSTVCFVSLTAKAFDKAARALRERVFRDAIQNDVGFFDEAGRANVETCITNDVKVVRDGVWSNLSRDRGVRAFVEVLLGIILCFSVTGRAGGPVFGVIVPLVSTVVAQMGLRNGRMAAKVGQKDSRIQFFLSERMRGLRTLKAFGAERMEILKLRSVLDNYERTASAFGFSKAITEGANRVSIYITIAAFFISGGLMICAGTLSFEVFTCLTGYIWILNFSMQGLSYTVADAAKMSKALQNIFAIEDAAIDYRNRGPPLRRSSSQIQNVRGAIRFEDVYFRYPSRPDAAVLNGITFSIEPGEMIALVGDSGGGKSTIAAMLSRFYAATAGQVTLDGIDIQTMSSETYTKLISVVDQDPVLFEGTIRENISYGLPDDDVDDAAIIQAATEANAHDFVMQLPNGYDTIWNPGSNLSGGQRQRIAIARSLVKSPRILVLDEATSALDQESESIVQSALERIMKNRTVLIIAHRLSTVRGADRILFVKDGEIIERGSYDDLLGRKDGSFRALVESASYVTAESSPKS